MAGVGIAGASPSMADPSVEVTEPVESSSCHATVSEGESIQAAINDASVGETVCVETGTYDEELTIETSGLTLTAAGAELPVLDGDGFAGVTVNATGVTVSEFEIRGYMRGITVLSDANSLAVLDTTLTETEVGIHLSEIDGATISHNNISANTERGIEFSSFSTQQNVDITDNTFQYNRHNAISSGFRSGVAASNILVENNTVTNNLGTSSSPAIRFNRGTEITVRNNIISDNGQIGIDFRESTTNSLIEGNTMVNNSRGVHLSSTSSIEVRDNNITAMRGTGVWFRESNDIAVVGNTLTDNQHAIQSMASSTDVLVADNVASNDRADLRLSETIDATVNNNTFGTGVRVAGSATNWDTQYFLHEFNANTVAGAPLVYIKNADNPTIDPAAGQLFVVNSTNVDISGLAFSDVPVGIQVVHSDGAIVTNNSVSNGVDTGFGGITVIESAGTTVAHNDLETVRHGVQLVGGSNSVVRQNTISETLTGLGSDTGLGVLVERGGVNHTIRENTVTGGIDGIHVRNSVSGTLVSENTIEDAERDGIHVRWNSDGTHLLDNSITGSGDRGIFIERAVDTTVETNLIHSNSQGIATNRDVENLHIVENTITEQSSQGIRFDPPGPFSSGDAADNVTITGNEIADNFREGVRIDEATNILVSDNNVTDNGHIDQWGFVRGGGIDVQDSATTTVRDNRIVSNVEGVTASGEEVDARFNWWGDASGPSGEGPGSGNSVSENVLFEPWYTSESGPSGFLSVTIDETNDPIVEGETLVVSVTVENTGSAEETQSISLTNFDGAVVDTTSITLSEGNSTSLTLMWDTPAGSAGTGAITVESDDDEDSRTVIIDIDETDIVVFGGEIEPATVDVEALEPVVVTGELYNQGTSAGEETITLTADGEVVNETTATLDAGELNRSGAVLEWMPDASLLNGTTSVDIELVLNGFVVGTVTIGEYYSDIQVIAASSSETELIAGESFYTIGSVYQAGTIDGPQDINFTATNQETNETTVLGTESLTLDPEYYLLGALNMTGTLTEAGTYDIEVGGQTAGTIEVIPAVSDIQVIAASSSTDELIAGESFYTIGSVYQAGTIDGPQDINFTATNQETNETTVLGTESLTLDPEYYLLGALNMTGTLTEAGTYDIEVGGQTAGTIEVIPAVSDIQVIAATSSETELVAGESFYTIGSVYQAGNIAGTEEFNLTATNQETNETTVLGTDTVTLEPEYYLLGALNITGTITEAGTYDIALDDQTAGTIEVQEAVSDIQVIAATSSETELVAGESFYTIGSVYQAGTIAGTEEFNLTATNQETNETTVLGTDTVTLSPGYYHLGALNMTGTIVEAGTYDIALGEQTAGTIEVQEAVSDIQVIAASTSAVELLEDEEFYVIGSLYQTGNIDGPQDINLTVTSEETGVETVLATESKTVSPGYYHLGGINVTASVGEAGNYTLSLGDREVGVISVEKPVTDIRVIGASLETVELLEGETTHVIGSVYQNGTDTATETIELTATNESGVTEVVGTQEITVSPGVYLLGGINISYTPEKAGIYNLTLGDRTAGTIEVQEAVSDIQVIAASSSETELIAGESFYTIGSVYQAGTITGTEEFNLTATNQETNETTVLGTESLTLDPGYYYLGALNMTGTLSEAGTYDIALDNQTAGTIEVQEAVSDIQVIAATSSETELVAGESFYTIGSVYQSGTIAGTEEFTLTATNQETDETTVLGTDTVTLSPGYYHLGALNMTGTLAEAGTYDIALGDQTAGTIEVAAAVSDIQVIAASSSTDEIVAGDSFYTIGSVYQAGTITGTEEFNLTATNQETDETTVLGTDTVTLDPGYYYLGALNMTGTLSDVGTYDIEVGGQTAGTVVVVEPTVTVETVDIGGHAQSVDTETGVDVVYASDSATVDVEIESDRAIESVSVLISSLSTTYTVGVDATHAHGNFWSADVPFNSLPDDGEYQVSAVAVGEYGGADSATAPKTLSIDRDAPSVSTTAETVDDEEATVTLESDEPLAGVPDVSATVTGTDGSTETVTVEMETAGDVATKFTGTLEFIGDGEYSLTAVGTDLAGNEGEDTATLSVNTGFTLSQELIVIDATGTTLAFNASGLSGLLSTGDSSELSGATSGEEELPVVLSENAANPHLGDGVIGAGFLTVTLDSFLAYQLESGAIESATLSLAVVESALPAGVDAAQLELHRFDGTGWNPIESTISDEDGTPFITASVTEPGTYGALFVDEQPPTVHNVSPADGETFDAATETVTAEVAYEDILSGVDLEAVTISVNGVDVTEENGTQITATSALHEIGVTPGESYTVSVTVVDMAGNAVTAETTFYIAPDGIDLTDDGNFASDRTGDGLFDDVTGDGNLTIADVQALFDNLSNPELQANAALFDFAGLNANHVSIFDVQALFNLRQAEIG